MVNKPINDLTPDSEFFTINSAFSRNNLRKLISKSLLMKTTTFDSDPLRSSSLIHSETVNETTLLPNDQEAFALEPIEVTVGKDKRKRRKRKLVVDERKNLTGDQIRAQLADTSDIVQSANVAPPTKLRYFILLCLTSITSIRFAMLCFTSKPCLLPWVPYITLISFALRFILLCLAYPIVIRLVLFNWG